MNGQRVRFLVSGPQDGGEFVSADAVRMAYSSLAGKAVEVKVPVGTVTELALERLEDGRVAIAGLMSVKPGYEGLLAAASAGLVGHVLDVRLPFHPMLNVSRDQRLLPAGEGDEG